MPAATLATVMATDAGTHSIRRALLLRLMGPLLVLTLLAGASAYGLARHFAEAVLDQWLYDSAISLASRVKWENGRASADLSDSARAIIELDVVDRVFYEVHAADGRRILGNVFMPDPSNFPRSSENNIFYESTINGTPVRVVALSIARPGVETVIVKVAETLRKRLTLARQVLLISVALSLVLAAMCAMLAWYGVGQGMASVQKAVREIRTLHASAPLEPIPTLGDLPLEVMPLVEEINNLILDLSSAHRLNQRFIADAAHQLRTPLATLRVQLELALREQDPERHARAINDAIEVLSRMGRVLHQLLTLARADEGYPEKNARPLVDIDRMAREEIEQRLDDAVAAGTDLGYDGPEQAVHVEGEEALLREALANLLDNALRYGRPGGQITVGVKAGPPAEIHVEDNGPGIPATERDKVRDRFYRMPASPGDGCGLGLAIVEEIARRHGVTLLLEDAEAAAGEEHNGQNGHKGLRARLVFPAA